jgi:hypothetical protein
MTTSVPSSISPDLLQQTREYTRRTVRNPRFRDYILLAIDEAEQGDTWRFTQCQNLKYMPVDIEEFLLSHEYVGSKDTSLWPAVVDELIEINSGGYVEALLTGGIGSAKTTTALYTQAYQLYLLSCYKNPHLTYALDPHSEILIVFQSITEKKAKSVGYDRFKSMIESSPYFRRNFPNNPNVESWMKFPNRIEVKPVSGGQFAAIGENVIGGLIDELNYMDVIEKSKRSIDGGTYNQAVAVYESIARRRKSRFHKLGSTPGMLCLVSSRRYPGQFTDTKEEEAKSDPTIYVYDKCVWDVKPEGTFTSGFFPVFTGDASRRPRVVQPKEKLSDDDQRLIKLVPEDYRREFERDIYDALREIAGVATMSQHPFIANREAVAECMRQGRRSIFSEEFTDFDQYTVGYYPNRMTDLHQPRFAHVDLGLTGDSAGVAIGYIQEFIEVDRNGVYETLPLIVIDGVLEVRPPQGGEIRFYKIREMFYKLREQGINIKWITYDSWQSVDSLQLLSHQGFKTGTASLDRDTRGYDFTKSAIYDIRLHMPEHAKTRDELLALERVTDKSKFKIDHPPRGSKDCSDAVAGVVRGLVTRRELYIRHGVSLSRIPESVQQILSRTQSMRAAEDAAVRHTERLTGSEPGEPMH